VVGEVLPRAFPAGRDGGTEGGAEEDWRGGKASAIAAHNKNKARIAIPALDTAITLCCSVRQCTRLIQAATRTEAADFFESDCSDLNSRTLILEPLFSTLEFSEIESLFGAGGWRFRRKGCEW
jgi:hypothetical protein